MAEVEGAVGGVAHSSQLNWLAQSEEEAVHDDLHQLLSETRGVVEKLADPAVKLGSWQLVLWQPRWVFAEIDGFCYQKISYVDVLRTLTQALHQSTKAASSTVRKALPFTPHAHTC